MLKIKERVETKEKFETECLEFVEVLKDLRQKLILDDENLEKCETKRRRIDGILKDIGSLGKETRRGFYKRTI
jgi:hypothetical protein